ncbi:MAG: ankyrin repeat domain-containing protein [Acidobacteriota bacterium]
MSDAGVARLSRFILCVGWCVGLALWPALAAAGGGPSSAAPLEPPRPFLLGGIQTHELDNQRWTAALHQAGMNAVQVTVYAHQGPWNTAKLWYAEEEEAVLAEIRAARQNGLQIVLILRVALDHNEPENRFLWHGLTYPKSDEALAEWFRIYIDFVVKWGRIAEEEGVDVLGVASEMNSLTATLPVDEIPGLPDYYLDDESQQRLRTLVGRSEHLFTEPLRVSMGAGDFPVLDDFLIERNRAERTWARTYTFVGANDRVVAINERRKKLDAHWRSLVQRAREVYSGRLTLAANFDNYHEVGFWDALDFIGINAYFPLRELLETPLSEGGLATAWRKIFADLEDFRKVHELDAPAVFTELGYTRWQGVTVAPWSSAGFIPLWDPEGVEERDRAFFWYTQPFDLEERALAMQALHRVWAEDHPPLAGVLYWKLSSRLDLQRYEPFMLYLGADAEDPLLPAFTRFGEHIRPFGPPGVGDDPHRQAIDAILRDDRQALVKRVEEIGVEAPAGETPLLHTAVRLGRGHLARDLVAAGAGLGVADPSGFLPVHWACYQPDPELVDLLLPTEDVSLSDSLGETPLMKCARLDNTLVLRRLLQRRPGLVSLRNDLQRAALHLAADQASEAMIAALLEGGADVDAADVDGMTPLHVAARRGELEIVELLARTSERRANGSGHRPVHVAAIYGNFEVFRRLFEPNISRKTNEEGHGLLHMAAYGGHPEILRATLEHYEDVDPQDHDGWTPLFFATQKVHAAAAGLLLERGAAVAQRDKEGTAAIHLAGACSDSRLLQQFLQQDPDVDLADADGNTPLHHAAGWGHLENLRLLLAAGADPSLRNREGDTALDIASESGRRRAAVLLRAAEDAVDPTARVSEGTSTARRDQ